MAKKFIWVFHPVLQKNKHFDQPNIKYTKLEGWKPAKLLIKWLNMIIKYIWRSYYVSVTVWRTWNYLNLHNNSMTSIIFSLSSSRWGHEARKRHLSKANSRARNWTKTAWLSVSYKSKVKSDGFWHHFRHYNFITFCNWQNHKEISSLRKKITMQKERNST